MTLNERALGAKYVSVSDYMMRRTSLVTDPRVHDLARPRDAYITYKVGVNHTCV